MHEAWKTGQEQYDREKPMLIEQGKYDLIIEDSDVHPTPKEKRLAKAEADHKFMVESSRKEREFLRRIGHPISAELEAECKDQPPSAELEAACEDQPLPETGSEDEPTPRPDDHSKWKSRKRSKLDSSSPDSIRGHFKNTRVGKEGEEDTDDDEEDADDNEGDTVVGEYTDHGGDSEYGL
ncbi:hypothetical protein CPAR01_14889 [Colletotrichum paranaense]|uniref:Uncharacterized protein n=1 Tax=Colletotrichum paranaense TaxID=1914294 RepID=A0ABQ9S093_9PEZI|nr:uncharacterized protein CPAR01_14889 [Colletotrichum paranaense]KAK1521366.1 hypothetical protein CPAR01_14889 [Colletotrichum paranaense]